MPKVKSRIVDASGQPFKVERGRRDMAQMSLTARKVEASARLKQFATYISALYGIQQPAMRRAEEPFSVHPWVYAGAMAIAINIGQAPFLPFKETDEQTQIRIAQVKKAGKSWTGPEAGSRRKAIERHLIARARRRGLRSKALEPIIDHPIMDVLSKPNDAMTGSMLWQATALFHVLRGSCMWVLFGEGGGPLAPGALPSEIWPMPPELFEPIYVNNRHVAWRFKVPRGVGRVFSQTITLQKHEVLEYKFVNPDPNNFVGGFAPLTPVAGAVTRDMHADEHNLATMVNGGDPGGVLLSDGEFEDPEEEDKVRKKWEDRHKGTRNRRRIAILTGGLKYISTGLTNQEMEFSVLKNMNRDEILAAMGVPKSILSITDAINYATAIAQKKLFWENRLMPMVRAYEDAFDGQILFNQPDDVVCAFDLSQVEALREGLSDAIATADKMSGTNLHMPPELSLETAGIDVEDYEGKDVALVVGLGVQRLEDVLDPPEPPPALPGLPGEGGPGAQNPGEGPGAAPGGGKPPRDPNKPPAPGLPAPSKAAPGEVERLSAIVNRIVQKGKRTTWNDLNRKLQIPATKSFAAAWRGYVQSERRVTLDRFDSVVGHRRVRSSARIKADEDFPLDDILSPLKDMKARLRGKVRPVYANTLHDTFDFTVKEIGGIAVFELDDPIIVAALDAREEILLGTAPETLQNNLRSSLRKGIENGETVQELRDRVGTTFDIASSSSKALQVARTESSGFINEARDRMFSAQGLTEQEWVTSGDEHVRDNHELYGSSGPHESGFNFLELSDGEGGQLRYPHDPEAPASEVINCRCIMIPV